MFLNWQDNGADSATGGAFELAFRKLFDEIGDPDNRSIDRAATDFLLWGLRLVRAWVSNHPRAHPHDVEAPVEGLHFRASTNPGSDARRGAMLDVNSGADGDFAVFGIGLQRMETGGLHQADHVGRGINGRQRGVMLRQGVLEFDYLFDFGVSAYGNGAGHGRKVNLAY